VAPRVRVGCTSWTYKDWQGSFYAEGTPPEALLRRYAQVFDLVEADATFYRMPAPETTARWASETPPGFTMTVKLSQRITHERAMADCADPLRAFVERVAPLQEAGKLGAILAQFPPFLPRSKAGAALGPFLDLLPKGHRFAFEFRNKSWFVPEVYEALRAHGAALVWGVEEQLATPPEVTTDFLYVRLIGPDRAFTKFDRVQRDLRPAMQALKERLDEHAQDCKEVYVLCSNHFEGHGPGTAARACEVLGLPPADLAAAKKGGPQRGLADFA
jgi:uncharacterized protein YecE (DUF72 family)